MTSASEPTMGCTPIASGVGLARLLPLFEREQSAGHRMVLATVIHTEGPTYTKPGAQLLIAADGEYAGLLSGGCIEGDLAERARQVSASGVAQRCRYDARSPDDLLFGLGSGCEGTMEILLQALLPQQQWQPLTRLRCAWQERRVERYTLLTEPYAGRPAGMSVFADGNCYGGEAPLEHESLPLLWIEQRPAPRLLLLGAGVDALPVAQLADFLGWEVTIVDHRAVYARAGRFPAGAQVLQVRPEQLGEHVRLAEYAAAVIMSHHYPSDFAYLKAVAAEPPLYVGLLGPAARRDRLLAALGRDTGSLIERLHGPAGLDIGARSPEAIALSIISEIHAVLGDRHRSRDTGFE